MTNAARTRRYAHASHETFALVVLLFFVSAVCPEMVAGAADQQVKADCEISKGPCTKKIGPLEVTLDIRPKPVSVMKENSFMVRIMPVPHPLPEKITIDLGMPGMFMGNNVVMLRKQAPGSYSGTGIIPRCPSGRRLWKVTVNVPEGGKVEYFFDVVR
ncbi:MAG TPA: hypothetical protein VMH06_06420 [Thermodesulfovibrionales bacterium]|nr:hypothetical protein [Thermodesulfovibrionales bacterium]